MSTAAYYMNKSSKINFIETNTIRLDPLGFRAASIDFQLDELKITINVFEQNEFLLYRTDSYDTFEEFMLDMGDIIQNGVYEKLPESLFINE